MAKPKVYRDTLNLLYLIDKISKDKGLPKRYRYGWYGDIQHISAEMLAEWHTSQLSATYDEKTEHLTAFLVKLNTIYSLLEVLIATQALLLAQLEGFRLRLSDRSHRTGAVLVPIRIGA